MQGTPPFFEEGVFLLSRARREEERGEAPSVHVRETGEGLSTEVGNVTGERQ